MHRFQNNNKLLKFQLLRLNEQCSFHGILRQILNLDLKLIEQLSEGELDNRSYGSTQPAARNSPQIKVP